MGIAGIWELGITEDRLPSWSIPMAPPVMQRFHKPAAEKRPVMILSDEAWGDWLRAKLEETARTMLRPIEAELLRIRPDPMPVGCPTDSLL